MADELDEGVATPEIAMSKAEFTEVIQRKIGEALAPKLRKLEEMQAQVETLSAQAAKAEELEAQLSGKTQTATQQWEAERAKHQAQQKAMQAQYEQAQAEKQATLDRWHGTVRQQQVTQWALKAGANPKAIDDAVRLFPAERVQISEQDGRLTAAMVDPETGLQQDATAAMSEWLKGKPHLLDKPNSGSGSGGAGVSPPTGPVDPLDGKHGVAAFRAAFHPGK